MGGGRERERAVSVRSMWTSWECVAVWMFEPCSVKHRIEAISSKTLVDVSRLRDAS